MKKMLCFDMDGTIADLYGVPCWLERLTSADATPYLSASPFMDMEKLRQVLLKLRNIGWEVRVISWLAKDSDEEYKEAVRMAKRAWLEKYQFPADKIHFIKHGRTKADSIRKYADYAILFDDNKKVRDGWHMGLAVNPETTDIIKFLKEML